MPRKQLTFVDASVLITAYSGADLTRKLRALAVLTDRQREFVASDFLRLETLPVAILRKDRKEQLFYERFFKRVQEWVEPAPLIQPAFQLCSKHLLGTIDALHLAAAIITKAEFFSAEKPTKPMYAAYAKAISIH